MIKYLLYSEMKRVLLFFLTAFGIVWPVGFQEHRNLCAAANGDYMLFDSFS